MKAFKKLTIAIATLIGAMAIGACTPSSGGQTMVDYAHNGSCVMRLPYKNIDFFDKGIGEFSLWTCIDGDTAHFLPAVTTTSGEIVKARFYGIDTPESTGRVQPYGKEASDFTKEHLKNAAENGTIVLSGVTSAYGKATTDSNGRYLVCVWINEEKKNCEPNELINLNLWIIQEGLADMGDFTKMPEYAEVFQKAFWQANELKLNKFSGKPAGKFNYGDYEDVYIPDIMKAVYASLKDPTAENPYNGAKVRVVGTVAGFANNTLFLQKIDYDDPETEEVEGDNKAYGINVYCGPSAASISKVYRTPGTVLELYGIAQDSEEFGFQITGAEGHFPDMPEFAADDDVKVLVKAADNVDPATALRKLDYTVAQLSSAATSGATDPIFAPVRVSGTVTVNYYNDNAVTNAAGEIVKSATAWTVGFKEGKFDLYVTFAYTDSEHPNDPYNDRAHWFGKVFEIKEAIYTYRKTKSGEIRYQLVLTDKENLVPVTSN